MKILASVLAAALCASPAFAQTVEPAQKPQTGFNGQRLYENSQPTVLQSTGEADATAATDPLGQVDEIALRLRFDCAETGCDKAFFLLLVQAEINEGAAAAFTVADGQIVAKINKTDRDTVDTPRTVAVKLHPGDTFDVRIHWTHGNRVSFDIYATDPATGIQRMESHDVRLGYPVKNLFMQSSHGKLTIVSQTYSFR